MKIARFNAGGTVSYGIIEGETVRATEGLPWESLKPTGQEYPLSSVKLLAPVLPPDIIAIGVNYKGHADELGHDYPPAPVIFIKASSSVTGPGESIMLPKMAPNEVDSEAELVIVIGKTCRRVGEDEALDYVLGYTCGNDVSARDAQMKQDIQWARAKSFDTFCPLGPWIETELDPDNVAIRQVLSGKVMQSSNTNDMIFPCRKLVSYCSQFATLRPGTVIMTGTPPGVGVGRNPQIFMKPGDTVCVEIEGIGTLKNPVEAE
jgi:2-keto-4-pentenoate hydratase/2-oxohepta-3-ene-1,7-dioic acid hydratase in catechol pathway